MIWGKKARGTTANRRRKNRLPHIALAALLVASLFPIAPSNQPAEAAEGTTRYDKVFAPQNIFGKPGNISGSTMRLASTKQSSYYEKYDWADIRASCSAFASSRPVSLNQSWEIVFSGSIPNLQTYPNISHVNASFSIALAHGPLLNSTTALCWKYAKATNKNPTTYLVQIENAMEIESTKANEMAVTGNDSQIRFSYDAQLDTGTLTIGSTNQTYNNLRTFCGNSAYLLFLGIIEWWPTDLSQLVPSVPSNLELSATFDSMTIPNLDPEIKDIQLYRINPATSKYDIPVGKDDELEPDEIVRAVCAVRNTNNSSASNRFSERFNMHLKLADTEAYPTQGIVPFADATHPLEVDGKAVATAPGDNTLTGANGVPLTLVGTTPVEVSYYAKVNQGSAAVSVSHELIEDSFQGSQFKTVELLPKRALVPGDPDDATLKPGTDYHYTRLPAANENGWNGAATSPVDVTFYAGDFDRFTVAGANGATLGTLFDGQKWTQSADVDALPVTYQATNTESGALSTTGEDTIRIDTQAPSLSYDAPTSTLAADDTGAPGKATSGIWQVERVKADGRALGTEDITPQSHAAALADEQTSWAFPLTDGKGAATQTVAGAQPGFYVATDAAGNRSAVFEVKEPETPVDPGPDEPTPPVDPTPDNPNKPGNDDPSGNNPGADKPVAPTITPKPSGDGDDPAPKPLAPTVTDKDPATGLQHDTVEHALTLPTAPDSITPAMMDQLIADRYAVTANRPDGAITAGPVSLFDAAGNPVSAIDRTRPGTWVAEQTFTDSVGNSTTIRLAVTVKENTISGTISSEGDSANGSDSSSSTGGGGENGSNGTGAGNALLTRLTDLPQTGGLIGPCPLHILFLLMIFAVSAYSVLRLTDEPRRRNSDAYRNDEALRARRYTVFDGLVHGVVALCAVALALRPFCLYDLLWAAATVVVVLFWSALFLHRSRSAKRTTAR